MNRNSSIASKDVVQIAMQSHSSPDSYRVLCQSFSPRVDRGTKLQSDSSGFEYRTRQFPMCWGKWKQSHCMPDTDSLGPSVRLLWGSNDVKCGHCSTGHVVLNHHQAVGVILLLYLKTNVLGDFLIASVCESWSLCCCRIHGPYSFLLPVLVHWVNPIFSQPGGMSTGWGLRHVHTCW